MVQSPARLEDESEVTSFGCCNNRCF